MDILFVLIPLAIVTLTIVALTFKKPWLAIGLAVLTGAGAVLFGMGFREHWVDVKRLREPIGRFQADLSKPGVYVADWSAPRVNPACHRVILCIAPATAVAEFETLEGTEDILQGLSVAITVRDSSGEVFFEKDYRAEDVNPTRNLPANAEGPAFGLMHQLPKGEYKLIVNVIEGAPGLEAVKHDLVARAELEYLPMMRDIMGLIALFFLIMFLANALGAGMIVYKQKKLRA